MARGAFSKEKSGISAAILLHNKAVVATVTNKGSGYRSVTVRQIDECESANSFSSSLLPVIAPVAGGLVFTKIISLPPMPKRELMPTILLTEKDSLPFPADGAHIDAIVLNSDDTLATHTVIKALVCAIPKAEAERLRAELSRFGLLLSAVVPYVMAISSMIKSEGIDGTVIVINAESDRTGIYILQDGVPIFIRDIPTGETPQNDDLQINSSHFSVISQEIDRTVKSFTGATPGAVIDAGFLTGFSPYLDEVGKKAEETTGISFHPLTPNVEFLCDDEFFSATAIAPLIGAAIDNGSSLNLLPSLSKRFFGFAKSHARAIKVAAILLFMLIATSSFLSYNADLNRKIDILESEVSHLENKKALYERAHSQLTLLNAENERLKETWRSYPSFSVSGSEWRRLFVEVATSTPYNVKLTTLNASFERIAAEGSGHNYWTKLSGQIKGSNYEKVTALQSLLGSLNSSPLFSSISIAAGKNNNATGSEEELFEFTIKAKAKPGAGNLATKAISGKGEG